MGQDQTRGSHPRNLHIPIKYNKKGQSYPAIHPAEKLLEHEGILKLRDIPFRNSIEISKVPPLFLENCELTVSQLLYTRYNTTKLFTEQDILKLLETVLYTLSYLQTKSNLVYADLCTENLFYDSENGAFKLFPLELCKGDALAAVVQEQKFRCLAPELVLAMRYGERHIEEDIGHKANIFTLGMIMLEVATLKPSVECYDLPAFDILEDVISQRLAMVREFYPEPLANIISLMLEYDYSERLDPHTLSLQVNRELLELRQNKLKPIVSQQIYYQRPGQQAGAYLPQQNTGQAFLNNSRLQPYQNNNNSVSPSRVRVVDPQYPVQPQYYNQEPPAYYNKAQMQSNNSNYIPKMVQARPAYQPQLPPQNYYEVHQPVPTQDNNETPRYNEQYTNEEELTTDVAYNPAYNPYGAAPNQIYYNHPPAGQFQQPQRTMYPEDAQYRSPIEDSGIERAVSKKSLHGYPPNQNIGYPNNNNRKSHSNLSPFKENTSNKPAGPRSGNVSGVNFSPSRAKPITPQPQGCGNGGQEFSRVTLSGMEDGITDSSISKLKEEIEKSRKLILEFQRTEGISDSSVNLRK